MPHHHAPRHRSRDEWVCEIFAQQHPIQAHLIGIPYRVELELAPDPRHVDHVWITVQVPPCGTVQLSVNTLSRLNLLAGFDPQVRVGILRSTWTEKLEPHLEPAAGLDYSTLEAESPIAFETWDHQRLSDLLLAHARAAVRLEAWGQLYRRDYLGLHQIHSRRASCAVPRDVVGRDGALRFYLPGGSAEMLLFKYCGQP